jgi:DDE domain
MWRVDETYIKVRGQWVPRITAPALKFRDIPEPLSQDTERFNSLHQNQDSVSGLRDLALIAAMFYNFALRKRECMSQKAWSNRRLSPEQTVMWPPLSGSFPGRRWSPEGDHLGWVCRLASGSHQPESGWNVTAPCKYLNNVVEQDHRRIKQRIRPTLGFKCFDTATVTIRGI